MVAPTASRDESAAKLEALLEPLRGALRVVVPLRTGKVSGWRQAVRERERRGTY